MNTGRLMWRLKVLSDPEGIHRVVLARAVHDLFSQWNGNVFGLTLDYGCGGRPYQNEIDRVSVRSLGVDIGNNECADRTITEGGTLPVDTGSVDLVTSFQVLEHVEDYQSYLRECARECRRGGKLVLSVPSVWPFHPHPQDFRRWMLPGLRYDLKEAGFEVSGSWPVLNPISSSMQYFLSTCRYTLNNRSRPARLCSTLLALWLNPQMLLSETFLRRTLTLGAGNYLVEATRV